jgi:hypothetical protein
MQSVAIVEDGSIWTTPKGNGINKPGGKRSLYAVVFWWAS